MGLSGFASVVDANGRARRYLQSEGPATLQPLHMVCLDKDQDILSLVKIPPHKGSEGQWIDKPMAWKQARPKAFLLLLTCTHISLQCS